MDTIWESVTQLYGEYGASHSGLVMIDLDETNKFAIIRANLHSLENVRSALAVITKINDVRTALHVLQVSGTIKSLRKQIKKSNNFE